MANAPVVPLVLPKRSMIAVERLTTILETVAASGFVKNANPLSVVLIAPPDGGKSMLIAKTLPPNARVVNDFTFASLLTVLTEPNPPNCIVVPDFNSVISHKPAVANLTMGFLLSLLAEGITEIPGVDEAAKLRAKQLKKDGVRIALITGMTPEMFYSRRGKWRETGLLRRLVPVNYTYSLTTEEKIQDAIKRGGDILDYAHNKLARLKKEHVSIPPHTADKIELISRRVVDDQLVWRFRSPSGDNRVQRAHAFPFSMHKVLRTYIKARARVGNRTTTNPEDFEQLRDFVKFIRYDRPEEL